ncbi:MAG: hypothetical protein ACJ8J0_06090 [Longimicrobiaceae bacterium]
MSTASAPAPAPVGRAELGLAARVLLCIAAITTGAAFLQGAAELQPLMVVTGLAALVAAAASTLRAERDWFNPLLLLVVTWMLRIGAPALYVRFVGPPPVFATLFHLSPRQWDQGFALALVGLVSIALGWMLLPRATARLGRSFAAALERTFVVDARTLVVGLLFLALGVGFIVIFLRLNYSSSTDAISNGMIRRGARVGGTSRYSFIASGLITFGSLAACSWLLLVRRTGWALALLPAVAATLVMSIFGGRVVALTPLAYACFALWYRSDRRHIRAGRVLLVALLGGVAFALYSIFIAFYRTGVGLKAAGMVMSTAGIDRYLAGPLWYEAGMLHPYTVAISFPPGVLHGASLPLTLGLGATLLKLDGVRPGQFMVEAILGRTQLRTWGWHSGLVIDAYMNYGLFAAILGGVLFGLLLRTVYSGFRARPGPVSTCFYVMLLWHFIWMYYEHTAATMNILIINFPFTVTILAAATLLPARMTRLAARLQPAGAG